MYVVSYQGIATRPESDARWGSFASGPMRPTWLDSVADNDERSKIQTWIGFDMGTLLVVDYCMDGYTAVKCQTNTMLWCTYVCVCVCVCMYVCVCVVYVCMYARMYCFLSYHLCFISLLVQYTLTYYSTLPGPCVVVGLGKDAFGEGGD